MNQLHNSLREQRITALSNQIERLTVSREDRDVVTQADVGESSVISNESIARHIKYRAGMIVDLRDDQIQELGKNLLQFFDSYNNNYVDKMAHDIAKMKTVVKIKNDFNDRISYLESHEDVEKLRQPVKTSYFNMFKTTGTLGDAAVDDYWKCLDLNNLLTELSNSEFVKSLPKPYVDESGLDKISKLKGLFQCLDENVSEQTEMIEVLLSRVIEVLARGEELSLAEKIDLNKNKVSCRGVVLTPVLVEAVNRSWYHNNLSTSLVSMSDDLKTVLHEPLELSKSIGDKVTDRTLLNIFTVLGNKQFVTDMLTLQRLFISITNKVISTSSKLMRFCDRIDDIPVSDTKGYYNYAIEDIARMISVYSSSLYVLLTFVEDFSHAFLKGMILVDHLSVNMMTHKQMVERYIAQRERQK